MVRASITIGTSDLSEQEITKLVLKQKIGKHHTFKIYLRQDSINKGLLAKKAEEWIGKKVVVGIGDKDDIDIGNSRIEDSFIGIVTKMRLERGGGESMIIVEGKSPSIHLDSNPAKRSYMDKSIMEIVEEVMNLGYSDSKEIQPMHHNSSIHYTVQYNETNYDFIIRLAEEYGEWCYYDGLTFYFGQPAIEDPILLDFGHNGLSKFRIAVEAVPTQFELKGYDYNTHENIDKPSDPYMVPTSELASKVWDLSTENIFKDAPPTTLNTTTEEEEIERIASRRVQIAVDGMEVITGITRNSNLKLGALIEVADQLIAEKYGSYLITSLEHQITQGGDYTNKFVGVPADLISPPLDNLPKEPFCEVQLATVKDVDDENGLGRVKVMFLWQEDGETSPWIRVASPYTGKDKGFYVIPEVDDQVLVAFENNNPDKPYVLSGMYNGDAKPEWFDGKNNIKGFKSKGQNQLKFDDKSKSILIDAPSTITLSAGDEINLNAGSKINLSAVDINIIATGKITIDGTGGVLVDGAAGVTIDGLGGVLVDGKAGVSIDGLGGVLIDGKANVMIDGLGGVTIDGKAGVTIDGVGGVLIDGKANVNIDGLGGVNISGATINLNS